jgi:hypothetical protein
MCDIATALLATSVAAGGVGAYGAYQTSKQNAAFARYEAAQMKEIGKANEAKARDRMSRLIAQQRAQIMTRGVRLDSPSALDLGQEAGQEAYTEAQAQRLNAQSRVAAKSNEAIIHDNTATTGLMNGIFGTAARGLTRALDLWPELQGA